MRVLEGSAEIATRYGGGFVQSIEGVEETERGGDPYDWFFFVDGVESPIGAAEYALEGGERIWWDYRDWSATNHVAGGGRLLAGAVRRRLRRRARTRWRSSARAGGRPARTVEAALEGEGVRLAAGGAEGRDPGPGRALGAAAHRPGGGADRGAARRESGVYADFEPRATAATSWWGSTKTATPARAFGPDAGLVAATRRYEGPPVWVVTGAARRRPCGPPPSCSTRRTCATITRWRARTGRRRRCRWSPMRSPFAYTPRPRAAAGGLAGRRRRLPGRAGRRRLPLLEPAGAAGRRRRRGRSPACWPAPGGRCGRRCGWAWRSRC